MLKERRWYVAHARGPNFDYLKERGFHHMYPTMDDYVFLEVTDANKKLLRKQTELCISFMKAAEEYVTISEQELNEMCKKTTDEIVVGGEVKVLLGYCENLEGVVNDRDRDKLKVTLKGYNRTYEVTLNVDQVVMKTPETAEMRIVSEEEILPLID